MTTNADETWYFAYGSNLSVRRMESRTRETHPWRLAYLEGYRLAFNQRDADGPIHANIVPQSDGVVWGVLYGCSRSALELLDEYEGVAEGQYERQPVTVVTPDGTRVAAMAYIAGAGFVSAEGRPAAEYLAQVVDGARGHGLPDWYVRRIEELAGRD
jgi:cation transport regulator ChaC